MKETKLAILLLWTLLVICQGCSKSFINPESTDSKTEITISEAKSFFDSNFTQKTNSQKTSSISTHEHSVVNAFSLHAQKRAVWENAITKSISIGSAIKIPLDFGKVYWKIDPKSKKVMPFNSLNYLLMYKDSLQKIQTEVVTLVPDSSWLYGDRSVYVGQIVVRSWKGKLIKVLNYKKTGAIQTIARNNSKVSATNKTNIHLHRSDTEEHEEIESGDVSGGPRFICLVVQDWAKCTCPNKNRCDLCSVCAVSICQWFDEIEDPNEPPETPIGGGTGSNGGETPQPGSGSGGSGPGGGDYTPNCNPDPNYVVPSTPAPEGTEWILPCGNEIPEPVEPNTPVVDPYFVPEDYGDIYQEEWYDIEDAFGTVSFELAAQGINNSDPIPEMYYKGGTSIDMLNAPQGSGKTVFGFTRNARYFWKQLLIKRPEMFSPSNLALIADKASPKIDATWILYNPTHKSYLNGDLTHHHDGQGRYAYAIPTTVHRKWSRILHEYRAAGKISTIKGTLNSLASAIGIFSLLTDLKTGNPDAWVSWFGPQDKVGQIYKDNTKNVYFEITKKIETKNAMGVVIYAKISYTVYADYIWDDDENKYMGVQKLGKFTEDIDVANMTSSNHLFSLN